jgi:S-(hydroxymethyl)glutathione dehydrogenase / alcohol dehydrogenase
MKAAILRAVNEPLTIEDVDIDQPMAQEVLIRTGAVGVCRSDLHFIEGGSGHPLPVVLGHESAGTVEAVGDQVTYVKPGDRVITCLSVFCGRCEMCLSGRPVLCTREGLTRADTDAPKLSASGERVHQFLRLSSFAEQMLVHQNAVVRVDDDTPFELLALIGCGVTTGLGAVLNTAQVRPGSTVAVIGCGGVGLSAVQGARIAGALRIIAIDTVETKLATAMEFGATDVVDASSSDPVEKVKALTGGGVDYSFEALGAKRTAEQAFEMLRPGGTATVVGVIPEGTKIELEGSAFLDEKRIQGSNMGSNRFRTDMPRYIELYRQGRLRLDEMVTQTMGLDEINHAFDELKTGSVNRSVIVF